ncbi:MAG: 2-oxoglutarate dehydrogenase E1 component [Rhabdochlamydiaceae bacterium]|nr:2-oxoglutarate dehydrogenase E1 component [Rhabdochlamydiaceae bacterium]
MSDDVFSYANLSNVAFLEDLHHRYQKDPKSVDPTWRYFFSGMEFSSLRERGGGDIGVFRLIQSYREHGHKKAAISFFAPSSQGVKELELSQFGLSEQDLGRMFFTFQLLPEKEAPLSEILQALEKIYCGSIGFEFMGVGSEAESWILSAVEQGSVKTLSKEQKQKTFRDLCAAELFEQFIHTKYPGQTRFSLEGGETFIPLVNALIQTGADCHAEAVYIGMAHRGRLNVLTHVLNKSYTQIFHEFEGTAEEEEGAGDVKYHKGAHSHIKTSSGNLIEVLLVPNPSHLESVDPVVEGQVRAKQDLKKDTSLRETVIPIIVHGDASLAGQGVVYELLQMGSLSGYKTGGTVHVVINNHIGYTTLPQEGRSTLYCTDIAKTFQSPVFHVNAEDPEACIFVANLAMKIRQKFHIDVFIDMNCFRKHGHNEGDEPMFTQPLQYKTIKQKISTRKMFEQKLLSESVLTAQEISAEESLIGNRLQEAYSSVQSQKGAKKESFFERKPKELQNTSLSLSKEDLIHLAECFCQVPKEFHVHPKLQKLMQERLKMLQEARIDWGMAEHLAFASLLREKIHIRLSGQDVERGTFAHRHSVLVDQETGQKYIPLNHLDSEQAFFAVYNSLLSEFAVMGFDLGYSLSYPNSLVLWEAQYGDFVNGSQVIIDQYLSTSEQKWARRSNMTLLLPHGYEGQGPEHSSARMERFLQLCAEDNLIIANCTTPAQLFHILRRQAHLVEKRPLVLFTPKMLIRHSSCVSSIEDFFQKSFQEVLEDPNPPSAPTRVLFCCGKVFYQLLQERLDRKDSTSLIVRVEQLYPFPEQEICQVLKKYPQIQKWYWVQEEPQNMGAWTYVEPRLSKVLHAAPIYAGREASASPAAGSHALHKRQYERFMQQVFLEVTK